VSDESETTVFAVAVAVAFVFAVFFAFVIGPGFSLDISASPKSGL
jgi:hypothetical protein